MSVATLIDDVENGCPDREHINLGHVIDALKENAIAALILLPALVAMCPASLIPGLTAVCALLVILASLHTVFGRATLWMPQRLRRIQFNRRKFLHSLARVRLWTRHLDSFCKQRWEFMTRGIAEKAATLVGAGLGVSSFALSLVPFVDMILMFPVVLFGLGLCTRDGLLVSLGWGFTAVMVSLVGWLL